jgi:Ca2+-binding RTX toxin-like protein
MITSSLVLVLVPSLTAALAQTLSGEPQANDYAVGGELNDIIATDGGSDYIFGLGGNDSIYAGAGIDYIYSNQGNDFIYTDDIGVSYTDYLYAGGGTGVDTVADFNSWSNHSLIAASFGRSWQSRNRHDTPPSHTVITHFPA